MRAVLFLLAALGVSVLLASCGSGGDSTESITTSTLSKAQFIKQANAICTNGTRPILPKLSSYEEKHKALAKGGEEKVFGEAIKVIVPPAIRAEIDQIRALGAPANDEEQVKAILIALESDVEGIENGKALTSPEELDAKFRNSGKLTVAYGVTACSYG